MTSVIPSPPKPDELAKEKPTQVNEGKARVTEVSSLRNLKQKLYKNPYD